MAEPAHKGGRYTPLLQRQVAEHRDISRRAFKWARRRGPRRARGHRASRTLSATDPHQRSRECAYLSPLVSGLGCEDGEVEGNRRADAGRVALNRLPDTRGTLCAPKRRTLRLAPGW